MRTISIQNNKLMSSPDNEVNIINRREIMPLLAKAWQILKHYYEATNCSVAVLDKSGKAVKRPGIPAEAATPEWFSVDSENRDSPLGTPTEPATPEWSGVDSENRGSPLADEKQMRYCGLCKKCFQNSPHTRKEIDFPCGKIHLAGLAESRRAGRGYIYACTAGFIFWTSPLYHKGRYAGALIAGGVIVLDGKNSMAEKFRSLCRDKSLANEFSTIIKEVPEKSHGEIQAMAGLLELCAEKISERDENPGKQIRRMTFAKSWKETNSKSSMEQQKSVIKKTRTDGKDNSEYPLEKERLLLAAFRRGDKEIGCKILKELMNYIIQAVPEDLEIIRFRAIELVVLLSRAAGTDSSLLVAANNRYLKRIQESKTAEELTENLNVIAGHMAGRIFSFQGIRHVSVLRKAERYIWENYTRKLSLKEIAKASGLSAPYFSTIFKEEMGENLSNYLNRLRVEKAAILLMEIGKPLNEIAELCGFEDQSWFSKIFKTYTGVSPGKFRKNGGRSSKFKPGRMYKKGEPVFSERNRQDMLLA